MLKDHLLALLRLRDPHDRSLGVKTLHLGMVETIEDVAALDVLRERSAQI
ncbi:hypothetical protein [Acrocarpospora sp. B8E8]